MTVGWNWSKCLEFKLVLKCRHQYHCRCSPETGTCIINDAGRQAAHKKTTKIHIFLVKSLQTTFYTHVLKLYINFQSKKTKTFKKITNWQALSLNKPLQNICVTADQEFVTFVIVTNQSSFPLQNFSRQDLLQSLVLTHYVYYKFIWWTTSCISLAILFSKEYLHNTR